METPPLAFRRSRPYTGGMAETEHKTAKPLAALDYLAQPGRHPARPVVAVFGDEAFLRRQALSALRDEVLSDKDGEFSLSVFDGDKAALRDVLDALTLASAPVDERTQSVWREVNWKSFQSI